MRKSCRSAYDATQMAGEGATNGAEQLKQRRLNEQRLSVNCAAEPALSECQTFQTTAPDSLTVRSRRQSGRSRALSRSSEPAMRSAKVRAHVNALDGSLTRCLRIRIRSALDLPLDWDERPYLEPGECGTPTLKTTSPGTCSQTSACMIDLWIHVVTPVRPRMQQSVRPRPSTHTRRTRRHGRGWRSCSAPAYNRARWANWSETRTAPHRPDSGTGRRRRT